MNCAEVSQKMELFVLDEVPEPEQVAIQAHLATCPACRAAESQYRLLVMQIKGALQPDSLRLDFVHAVRSAAKARIQAIARRSLARRTIAVAASVAVCLLFALAIWHARILERGPLGSSSEEARGTGRGAHTPAVAAPSILQVWQHRGALSMPGSMADGVVIRGRVMYLLQEYGRQARVAALDIKTGRQKWLSDIQGYGHILADDSRVYCLTPSGAGKVNLVALDAADGKTLWIYPQQCSDPLRSPPRPTLLPEGRICWTANTNVQMLSCADGELLWVHSIPDGGLLSAAVSVNDDIYVANAGGIYCLNSATGDESWRLACGDVMSRGDRPLLAATGAELYASLSLSAGSSRLLCTDLTAHKILWSKDVAHVTHLYATGGMLYLRDQDVQALDGMTGQLLWACPATGCNPVTYAQDFAYFIDSRDHGYLVALNRYTGCKVWELAGMKSCNAFIKIGGTGYVKTHDGIVHAIVFRG